MKIGHLDCFSGISGDMCLGALVDAGVPIDAIEEALGGLPLHGFSLSVSRVIRCGIAATRVEVRLDESEHQPHRGLADVLAIIEGGSLPDDVVERSSDVFRSLAEAEARVHGTHVDAIHFHEVGAVDAICDIVGTAVGLRELDVGRLTFSTVALGGGTVKCAHGILPVPAPATAELLKGLPTTGGPVDVELATPTGAAILKTLAEPAPSWPAMSAQAVAYGAGGRDLADLPNVLRLTVGQAQGAADLEADCVWVLEANLDDMTGEEIGHCTERLLAAGALDAFATPVQMKKGRPGIVLTVLCTPGGLGAMEELVFRHTSTFGVRRSMWQRSKLRRQVRSVLTRWGEVRVKLGFLGDAAVRCEPEYEDCRALADANGLSLRDVYRAAAQAAQCEGEAQGESPE
jgi:uncharacterized protein (TIGR00299 family) protein